MSADTLQAPFIYFGGKSRIASEVWARLGDPVNYVEPFAGSLAVLLARLSEPKTETVNDLDGMISNFWRGIKHDPEAVAHFADWPVNETDIMARHAWLVSQRATLTARLEGSPDFFDAKIAGWWCWGINCWIGSGWCSGEGPWMVEDGAMVDARQLPHLGGGGRGVNRKLPHLGDAGRGTNKATALYEWFDVLSDRLRGVRVACGDWQRVLGPSVTTGHGVTGVFLDPPYSKAADRAKVYTEDCDQVANAVREWAIANGENPLLRIALCGYEGEHAMPASWERLPWKARKGYGGQAQSGSNDNSLRERIYFSPACQQADLFGGAA